MASLRRSNSANLRTPNKKNNTSGKNSARSTISQVIC